MRFLTAFSRLINYMKLHFTFSRVNAVTGSFAIGSLTNLQEAIHYLLIKAKIKKMETSNND